MPNRIIRDGCKTSPTLASIGNLAERTFWRLTTVLDDHGRYHGDPQAVMAACYPVGAKGVSMAHLKTALVELKDADLIRWYTDAGRGYLYSPTWGIHQRLRGSNSKFPEPLCSQGVPQAAANVRKCPQMSPGDGVGIGVGNVTPLPPTGGGDLLGGEKVTPAPESGFKAFWARYPLKRGKGKAEAIWRRLRPSQRVQGDILKAIAWQIGSEEWTKDGGQFIPHPATYLNQRRWEDEPDTGGRRSLADIEREIDERGGGW